MQTDAEVAAIAAGLTKAQQATLICGEESHSDVTDPALDKFWFCITKLHDGIFHIDLNSLGLRVAQHLKQENAK